jgi:hypothetical protein
MAEPPPLIVSNRELREMFNNGGYVERAEHGALIIEIISDSHPTAPLADEPFCTRSQMIEYRTPAGAPVAVAHRYLRTDGTIGLSGRPDPKMVLHRGMTYLPLEP